MNKKILNILLAAFLVGNFSNAIAEENKVLGQKVIESKTDVPKEEPTLETKFNNILAEVKKQNINEEDFLEYSRSIKEKLSVNIVNYFNEIENNLDILTENGSNLSKELTAKIDELRKNMTESIQKYNEDNKDFDLKKEFESISEQYINIIKEYKTEVENKVKN